MHMVKFCTSSVHPSLLDRNLIQCSGCSVAPRSSISDTLKEDNIPKFKNSWYVSNLSIELVTGYLRINCAGLSVA